MKHTINYRLEKRIDNSKDFVKTNGIKKTKDFLKEKEKKMTDEQIWTKILIDNNIPIIADVRFAGMRLNYFTGFRIDAENFKNEEQEVKKNRYGLKGKIKTPYNIINSRLKLIRAGLVTYFDRVNETTKADVKSVLDTICKKAIRRSKTEITNKDVDVNDFYAMFDNYLEQSRLSQWRIKHNKSLKQHLENFDTRRNKKTTFKCVNASYLKEFEKYFNSLPVGTNTINCYMSMLRTFLKNISTILQQHNIKIDYPFGKGLYEIPEETYGTPIYITIDERNKIYAKDFESDKLNRVRDIFVFQCLIGARFGDLCKLTKDNIQGDILSYIARKTKNKKPVTVEIPLHPIAKEILSRYNMPDGKLLPFITDQRYNEYLKEVFRLAEVTRKVTRLNARTGEEETVQINEIASSHMARRTFVGSLFNKEVTTDIICSMSGHKPGSKAFERYYTVEPELKENAIFKI